MTNRPASALADLELKVGTPHAAGLDRLHLIAVSFVPEIHLHLAEDAIVWWARMEAEAGESLPAPFWASAWAGGLAVARYVLDHPDVVAGRRVLDLASGSGLVAIAAAKAGAATVLANDIDPYALAAITLNARANGVVVSGCYGDLLDGDGGDPVLSDLRHGDSLRGGPPYPYGLYPNGPYPNGPYPNGPYPNGNGADGDLAGVVLAGDVFYSPAMAERVMDFLQRATARGALVLVGDPGRDWLPQDRLEGVASYEVPMADAFPTAESTTVNVLRPRR